MNRIGMLSTAGLLMMSGSALAYVNTMYNVGFQPSSIGSEIASLDANSVYDWNAPTNISPGNTQSAFTLDVPLGGGSFFQAGESSLVTRVYRVDTPTVLTDASGDLTLDAGDLVFEYTLDLVDGMGSDNVLSTFQEFDVSAAVPNAFFPDAINSALFDETIVKGRGFSVTGLGNGTAQIPDADNNDAEFNQALPPLLPDPFLSSLAWQFDGGQLEEMTDGTSIRFLMFTKPATIEEGRSSLTANPGQVTGDTQTIANGVPVLVPVVPAPGAGLLALVAGATGVSGRRRKG